MKRRININKSVSVIIGIKDRYDSRIVNSLESIRNQTYHNGLIEIILVDYGSNERYYDDFKKLVHQFNLCGIWTNVKSKWSRAHCLNIGIKHSSAEYLLLSDVDIIFEKDYIEECIYQVQSNQNQGLYSQMLDLAKDAINSQTNCLKDYDKIKQIAKYRGLEVKGPYGESILFVKHKFVKQLRGYDENYKIWGFEDGDLNLRLRAKGVKIHNISEMTSHIHQWHEKYEGAKDLPEFEKQKLENSKYFENPVLGIRNPDGWGQGKGFMKINFENKFTFLFNKIRFINLQNFMSILNKRKDRYLSLCVIAKNEASYILEWIEYHRMVGVDHFYFYDNNSTDNTKSILQYYIEKKTVDYTFFSKHPGQLLAYEDCIKRNKNDSRWIGFIDIDEFIVPLGTKSLPDFLKSYEGSNGLGINWVMYGSSGFKERPKGLQLENFVYHSVKDFSPNRHIKSIVDPQRVLSVGGTPHFFNYKDGEGILDEDGQILGKDSFSKTHKSEKIRINHYNLRSLSEFRDKMARGRATVKASHKWELFNLHDRNEVKDSFMRKYLFQLKWRINLRNLI